jgi:hypothetical protein
MLENSKFIHETFLVIFLDQIKDATVGKSASARTELA